MTQKLRVSSNVTKETVLTLLPCTHDCCSMSLAEVAGLWFSAQTPVITDFCLWKLPLRLCSVSCPLSLCQCPGSVLTRQCSEPQTPGPPLLGSQLGGPHGKRVCFASGFTIRASKQFSTIWGNWSHRVKFQLVNTFRLRDSNSINIFVKKQIYLHRVLRIMPKPFVLNNRKALKLKESF